MLYFSPLRPRPGLTIIYYPRECGPSELVLPYCKCAHKWPCTDRRAAGAAATQRAQVGSIEPHRKERAGKNGILGPAGTGLCRIHTKQRSERNTSGNCACTRRCVEDDGTQGLSDGGGGSFIIFFFFTPTDRSESFENYFRPKLFL